MFYRIPEQWMHRMRWLLTCSWLILTLSLFYDPISAQLTHPNHPWSPLSVNPETCVKVQGVCLEQKPYALGAAIFWCYVVPSGIFILLVFGHELWRRICPLSFLSQIPRALGIQRKHKRINPLTGKIRYKLARVSQNSWLGQNYLYLQFGLLFLGLCFRILFVNSERWALGVVIFITMAAAITVGYLYGGKSWCQYFCPMSPVQRIFGEPGGLLTSKAHEGDTTNVTLSAKHTLRERERQPITQSMCRVVNTNGKERSNCVGCQNPCIDIDAERSYWLGVSQPNRKFLYYGYVGLVIGYFIYYYLYSGNWNYYFSGAWTHEENQVASVMEPGFYLWGNLSPIPKLVAVPLTLALFTWGGCSVGKKLEKFYKTYQLKRNPSLSAIQIQHQIFTLCTYFIFNFFFLFGSQSLLKLLPPLGVHLFELVIILVSTLWLCRTWGRSLQLYTQEKLASLLRKRLEKLQQDVPQFLEGCSIDSLNSNEIYLLAYKTLLRESSQNGLFNSAESREILRKMQFELEMNDQEYQIILDEIQTEDLNCSRRQEEKPYSI